jgi:hypothetical protein
MPVRQPAQVEHQTGDKKSRAWHGLLEAGGTQAGADFAPHAEQLECRDIRAAGCREQLLVPEHEAGCLGVTQQQLAVQTRVHLRKHVW